MTFHLATGAKELAEVVEDEPPFVVVWQKTKPTVDGKKAAWFVVKMPTDMNEQGLVEVLDEYGRMAFSAEGEDSYGEGDGGGEDED